MITIGVVESQFSQFLYSKYERIGVHFLDRCNDIHMGHEGEKWTLLCLYISDP